MFVDTGAFIALADKRDKYHRSAERTLRDLAKSRRQLVTTTYIADEAITLVRMRIDHAAARRVGDSIFSSRWCQLLEIDDALRPSAWNLFVRYDDQKFSFADCTSFALMTALGLEHALTVDFGDFAAAGFVPLQLSPRSGR